MPLSKSTKRFIKKPVWTVNLAKWVFQTTKTFANIFPHGFQVFRKKLRAEEYCLINSPKDISATSHLFDGSRK